MKSKEIARREWQRFCDDFSRKHRGEKVSVDVLDRDLGAQREIENQPFVGISADEKNGENIIEVMVGGQPNRNEERIINNPAHLRVAEGGKPAIEIEARDGPTTIVTFDE